MIDCAILIYIKSQLNENDEEASRSRSDHAIFKAESSLIQRKKKNRDCLGRWHPYRYYRSLS